jgi:hypothetical protein
MWTPFAFDVAMSWKQMFTEIYLREKQFIQPYVYRCMRMYSYKKLVLFYTLFIIINRL